MFLYKIRESGDDKATFPTFFAIRNNIVHRNTPIFWPFEAPEIHKNSTIKKRFFKMSQVLIPTIINEKTQLCKGLSVSKGLERHFHDENKKSIFDIKNEKPRVLHEKGSEVQLLGIFTPPKRVVWDFFFRL